MMGKFVVGDRVRIVLSKEDDLGFVDYITAIDEDGLLCVGNEDAPYPKGCWHKAGELVLIAGADAIENARQDTPAANATTADAGDNTGIGWPKRDLDELGFSAMGLQDTVADDSGYSELIDSLSGRIKGLERDLAAAQQRIRDLEAANDALVAGRRAEENLATTEKRKMESKLNEILVALNSPDTLCGPICEHNLNVILIRIRERKA